MEPLPKQFRLLGVTTDSSSQRINTLYCWCARQRAPVHTLVDLPVSLQTAGGSKVFSTSLVGTPGSTTHEH